VGSATLGPGLGGLWGFADPLAKRLLIRQLVILGLLRIAPLRRLVPEGILERPLRLNGLKQCGFETDGCVISVDDTAIKHKLATARGPLPPAAARALPTQS